MAAERGAHVDPDAAGHRIGELYDRLQANLQPAPWRDVAELVQLVTAIHGAGLARILELARADPAGAPALAAITADPLVASLLAVHNLDPSPDVSPGAQPVHISPRRSESR